MLRISGFWLEYAAGRRHLAGEFAARDALLDLIEQHERLSMPRWLALDDAHQRAVAAAVAQCFAALVRDE